MTKDRFRSIEFKEDVLHLLDQRVLPHTTTYITARNHEVVFDAIRSMAVRGAPVIGLAAAYGVYLAANNALSKNEENFKSSVETAIAYLKTSRPTAVNLFWALQMMEQVVREYGDNPKECAKQLLLKADILFNADIETNKSIAQQALSLIPDSANIIHHCNTGSLATADYGTALGIIRYAHEKGKSIHAFLDETRPRLQGASLSAFELSAFGVPHTIIVDSASGHVMKTKKIDLCVVGCDRVARNGDTANKIGTYNLALVAKAHKVPFYVACPTTTIDLETPNGDAIEIETRSEEEITKIGSEQVAPIGSKAYNPAFDVTPGDLVTAFITEKGIVYPPYEQNLTQLLK